MDNLNIGNKIKKLRELRNLTQEHMASSLGLSQSAYSRMELGETEITFSKLEKISEELGMKPEELIAFNENMVFNVMNNQTGNGLVINNNVPREEVNHVEVGHPVPHNDEENEEERISDTEIDIKINIHADKKDHHTFHIERGE
jgi:transcriptional regulator with XRE-family HTH domain